MKGNRDAGSSCLCDRGVHRYLRNFGGGEGSLNTPTPPPVRHWTTRYLVLRFVEGGLPKGGGINRRGEWCSCLWRQRPRGSTTNTSKKKGFLRSTDPKLLNQITGRTNHLLCQHTQYILSRNSYMFRSFWKSHKDDGRYSTKLQVQGK